VIISELPVVYVGLECYPDGLQQGLCLSTIEPYDIYVLVCTQHNSHFPCSSFWHATYKATPNSVQLLCPFQTYAAGLCNWNVKYNFLRETVIVSCNFHSTQGYGLQGFDAM
jgi:hypothetical protein